MAATLCKLIETVNLTNITHVPYFQSNYCQDVRTRCSEFIYIYVYITVPLCLAGIVGNLLAILGFRL